MTNTDNINEIEKIKEYETKIIWELSKEEIPDYIIFSNGRVSSIIGDSEQALWGFSILVNDLLDSGITKKELKKAFRMGFWLEKERVDDEE